MPVIAAATPSDCFDAAIEAVRVAVKYRMPVMLLTDGYLANGAEPWKLPEMDELSPIDCDVATAADAEGFLPYVRDPDTLARPWALPGTEGLEHRIGGLEKQDGTGNVSYDPNNHEFMCKMRAQKVQKVSAMVPDVEPYGDAGGVLCVSWGGTYGAVRSAVDAARTNGLACAHIHLRWLNPLPANLQATLASYSQVLVPELNLGQLSTYLRAEYLADVKSYTKIQGKPFKVSELVNEIRKLSLLN